MRVMTCLMVSLLAYGVKAQQATAGATNRVAKAGVTNVAAKAGATNAIVKAAQEAPKPKFTKQQVERRLRELKGLYERGLLTQEFYERKVKECEVEG